MADITQRLVAKVAVFVLTTAIAAYSTLAHADPKLVWDDETGQVLLPEIEVRVPEGTMRDVDLSIFRERIPIEVDHTRFHTTLPHERHDPERHFQTAMTRYRDKFRKYQIRTTLDQLARERIGEPFQGPAVLETTLENHLDSLWQFGKKNTESVARCFDGHGGSRECGEALVKLTGGEVGGRLGNRILSGFVKVAGKLSKFVVRKNWHGQLVVFLFSQSSETVSGAGYNRLNDVADGIAGEFKSKKDLKNWFEKAQSRIGECFDGYGGTRRCGKFVAGTLVAGVAMGKLMSRLPPTTNPAAQVGIAVVGTPIAFKVGTMAFDGLSKAADWTADRLHQAVHSR